MAKEVASTATAQKYLKTYTNAVNQNLTRIKDAAAIKNTHGDGAAPKVPSGLIENALTTLIAQNHILPIYNSATLDAP